MTWFLGSTLHPGVALYHLDKYVQDKKKGKFYRTTIRPTMLYGSECWTLKRQHENKMDVADMRMLRWMSGYTIKDKIRNDHIRERVG